MTLLHDFISEDALRNLIQDARQEDLGPDGIDATSQLFVEADRRCVARMTARQDGVVAGLALLPNIIAAYDPAVQLSATAVDGSAVERGDVVAEFRGPLRSVLMLERVALNFAGHLSGVATHTAAFARRIAHTDARVFDTRKTLPGLRGLQKYAVACGGGGTHRMGLYDAVLVKDNHLAHVPRDEMTRAIRRMADRARQEIRGLKFVMVEVDRLDQLDRVLPAGVDLVLLDNMPPDVLVQAVARRDAALSAGHPRIQLEASGGITLETVTAVAEAGVDRISVGALTHSSANLDLGLDLEG
jgi:nicotinate-nucleotide pyrophosphorylase (carboxylating)